MNPNTPIVYRAYGTVRGIYKPSRTDPTKGILVTEDKEKFHATLIGEVADLFTSNSEETKKLTKQCLWKCYFRTKPVTLELKAAETIHVNKPRYHSFKVDKFQVQGKLNKVNKTTVQVEIQPTNEEIQPFTWQLKGKFTEDASYPFWRFNLIRKRRSFEIVSLKKIELTDEQTIEETVEEFTVTESELEPVHTKKITEKSQKESVNTTEDVIEVKSEKKPQFRSLIKKK